MQEITEQQILAMAPNANAAANGKKISAKSGFVRLECSADGTFYLGECSGSGKNNYITSADFIEPAAPVIRCSCPSRQFPCKHGLALLYEILGKKPFAECEIPEDILKKRERKQARDAKKEDGGAEDGGDASSSGGAGKAAAAKPKKTSKAAYTKKLKKQLEGLELLHKLVQDLMKAGLGTMGGTALATYRQLAKQLGDYYLPGPQRLLNGLILEMEEFQKDGQERHYDAALAVLERIHALEKKSTVYLAGKLESGEAAPDDNLLYEELGGVWKLSELAGLGLAKERVSLMQLAFWVSFDRARNEYIDTGCWVDLDSGEISMTYNYRPLKALKYVKQEDSVFGVAEIPSAAYYPGVGNRRVRWESAAVRSFTETDLEKARGLASGSLAQSVRQAKNILKDTLADPAVFGLFSYVRIGCIGEDVVLEDPEGTVILLGNIPGMEDTVQHLLLLPDAALFTGQQLLGGVFYDAGRKRMCLQPISIITGSQVVRLLY